MTVNLVCPEVDALRTSPTPLLSTTSAAKDDVADMEAADVVPKLLTTSKKPNGLVVPKPIFPVPLGLRTKFSLVPVVISVVAPLNVSPVDPIVLFVSVWVKSSMTTVSLALGNVIVVPSVPLNVRPLLITTVFPSPICSVVALEKGLPEVFVTVNPFTFLAFCA